MSDTVPNYETPTEKSERDRWESYRSLQFSLMLISAIFTGSLGVYIFKNWDDGVIVGAAGSFIISCIIYPRLFPFNKTEVKP